MVETAESVKLRSRRLKIDGERGRRSSVLKGVDSISGRENLLKR